MTARGLLIRALVSAVAGVTLSPGNTAHAQPACSDAFFQREINACAALRFEAANASLESVYQAALARMKAQDKDLADVDQRLAGAEEALIRAQAAWVDYRDAHCAVMAAPARGGSMEPMVVSSCRTELSEARLRELQDMLDSMGG